MGTTSLAQAMIDDHRQRAPRAAILVGDLNALSEDISAVRAFLENLRWVDLGALAMWIQS